MNESTSRQVQDGLWVITRADTNVQIWLAIAYDITFMSYSEENARLWLSRERDRR